MSLFFLIILFSIPFLPFLISIWNDFHLIISTSGIIYLLFLILAIPLIYIFYFTFHFFYNFTKYLGEYHRFPSKKGRFIYKLKIFGHYFLLTIPTYLTILSLVQLRSSSNLFEFIIIIPMMLSFLISLRLLAHPTWFIYRILYKKNQLSISLDDKEKIKDIKAQVTPFYFGLIEVGLIVFIMGLFVEDTKQKLISNLTVLISPPENLLILAIAYFISLSILGLFSEWFLETGDVIMPDD